MRRRSAKQAPQPLAVEPEAGVAANGTPARARRAPRGADAAVDAHVARISSSRAGKRGGVVDENNVAPNIPLPKVQRKPLAEKAEGPRAERSLRSRK